MRAICVVHLKDRERAKDLMLMLFFDGNNRLDSNGKQHALL